MSSTLSPQPTRRWFSDLFPSLMAGSVVAMMTVVLSVSFVSLIFVGPMMKLVPEGTNLMLLTAIIGAVFMALFSSYAGTISIPQDRVAPIVGLMAGLIVQQMQGRSNPERVGVTVLAAIALSAIAVGLALYLLGAYKLGNVVRFIPYPVIGGFLAGTGWLLLTGSFRVITGQNFSISPLVHSNELLAWAPCAAFGTVAYLGVRFTRHYSTLPLVVISAFVLFYAWLGYNHTSWDEARARAWILGAPPDAGLHSVRPLPSLLHADWPVVFGQYGSLCAMLLTSIVSILLNTTALEIAADEEIDLNKELRAAGLANLFGGFAGGMIGFQSLSLSSLPINMGVKSRLVGLFSAAVCLFLLWHGTALLGYIPRFILGGILFYNGLSFLTEWVFDAYFRLLREDYFLVMLILAIVAMTGYLQGVGAGVIIATVLFVVKYSAVSVVSHELSGDNHHSAVDRSPIEARLLHAHGGQIHIMRLNGFVFFGSANNLLESIRDRHANPVPPPLGYVVLDFQRVSGLDTSGIVSLTKLSNFARKEGFLVLAASVPPAIENSFRVAGLLGEGPGQIILAHDRDHALEWCEDEILRREKADSTDEARSLPEILRDAHPWRVDNTALLRYVERQQIESNHYLILQGDPSDALYFIESGRVKVIIELDNGRILRVRTMGPGTVVGEIGLYLEQQRVASIVTETCCTVYRLSAESLRRMEQEEPDLASAFHEFMARVLAERVTQQNRTLRTLID